MPVEENDCNNRLKEQNGMVLTYLYYTFYVNHASKVLNYTLHSIE